MSEQTFSLTIAEVQHKDEVTNIKKIVVTTHGDIKILTNIADFLKALEKERHEAPHIG